MKILKFYDGIEKVSRTAAVHAVVLSSCDS